MFRLKSKPLNTAFKDCQNLVPQVSPFLFFNPASPPKTSLATFSIVPCSQAHKRVVLRNIQAVLPLETFSSGNACDLLMHVLQSFSWLPCPQKSTFSSLGTSIPSPGLPLSEWIMLHLCQLHHEDEVLWGQWLCLWLKAVVREPHLAPKEQQYIFSARPWMFYGDNVYIRYFLCCCYNSESGQKQFKDRKVNFGLQSQGIQSIIVIKV